MGKLKKAKSMDLTSYRKYVPDVAKAEQWFEDVGYSIANIWGLGEEANAIINGLKGLISGKSFKTLTANDLINLLRQFIGNDINKLSAAINAIDAKMSSLPYAYSSNMKNAISKAKKQYLKDRAAYADQLQKAEQTMNVGMQTAAIQDMSAPSVKHKNADLVKGLITEYESSKNNSIQDAVERKIN